MTQLPVLQTTELKQSEVLLRRAHLVLAWLMHFYINTLHPTAPIIIPRSISIPLLEVSDYMILPPVLTYSDDVLYNWKFKNAETTTGLPTSDNICIQTSFTSTVSEEHFYLVPAYMELRGAVALSLMSLIMDEAYVRDSIALRRISRYLQHLSHVINDLTTILMTMREKCDPDVFYHEVRPWFKGQDSMKGERRWVFEGVGEPEYEHLKQPSDDQLHGPSAGQSSLIHAIDTFLGVESHKASISGASQKGKEKQEESFLGRMQKYMPRHHRAFLRHLATNPRPLRVIVDEETTEGRNPELQIAYNEAVQSLKNLRDFHLRIVAMYIIGPSRRVAAGQRGIPGTSQTASVATTDVPVEKGTGGTNAMVFLKGIRDRTADAVLVSNLDITTI